jgi:hypothetical protein
MTRKGKVKVKRHRSDDYWRLNVSDPQVRSELRMMDDGITDLEDRCNQLTVSVTGVILVVCVLAVAVGVVAYLCLVR